MTIGLGKDKASSVPSVASIVMLKQKELKAYGRTPVIVAASKRVGTIVHRLNLMAAILEAGIGIGKGALLQ